MSKSTKLAWELLAVAALIAPKRTHHEPQTHHCKENYKQNKKEDKESDRPEVL